MIESDYLKDNSDIVQKLRKIPTLEPFDEKDLHGALQLSKIRKYEPGELILGEGLYDCWIYFLVSGKVRVDKQGEALTILKRRGDVFGEMSIIDGSPRSASVYAIDETVCLATDASYIDRLSGNDRIAYCYILFRVFAESLAGRLRLTNEELIRAKEEIARLKREGNK
ncbi:MAG: Crp/Fnr family transcriptional regulator [Deltaproteobacteria bacterium]|nr:Crp/Fnr family transcriptional regulator [Deltaproteobacteria bacterium]